MPDKKSLAHELDIDIYINIILFKNFIENGIWKYFKRKIPLNYQKKFVNFSYTYNIRKISCMLHAVLKMGE